MGMQLLQVVAVLIVWYLLWIGIGQIPEPTPPSKPPFPIKGFLYVLDCLVAAFFILRIVGLL